MAATQYSDYYYNTNHSSNNNNNSSTSISSSNIATYHHYHHHHQSQQQNFYSYPSGQYDCKNLNVNDAYNNYNYNLPNNYNDQWNQYYNATTQHAQHSQQYYQQQQQQLNMLNDDYKNYHNYNDSNKATTHADISRPSTIANEQQNQPNLNCNQYSDVKNDLYYGAQQQPLVSECNINGSSSRSNSAKANASSQLAGCESRKRKIDDEADSPALRALLSKPAKRGRQVKSPYFYYSHGSVSPASSTSDNFTIQHYQLPSVVEQSINLSNYKSKDGYEASIEENVLQGTSSPMSSSFIEGMATPPSSPKELSKHDESANSVSWQEQNDGKQ
jgi:hypothetical protein